MKRIGDFHQRRILQFCAFSISCFSIYSILLHYHFHPDHEPQFQESGSKLKTLYSINIRKSPQHDSSLYNGYTMVVLWREYFKYKLSTKKTKPIQSQFILNNTEYDCKSAKHVYDFPLKVNLNALFQPCIKLSKGALPISV